MNQQLDITSDRKRWHRPIDQFDEVDTCDFCGKPLTLTADPANDSVELVCTYRFCPGK
jgi:hypothetical protein